MPKHEGVNIRLDDRMHHDDAGEADDHIEGAESLLWSSGAVQGR